MKVKLAILSSMKESALLKGGKMPEATVDDYSYETAINLRKSIVGNDDNECVLMSVEELGSGDVRMIYGTYYEREAPEGWDWVHVDDVDYSTTGRVYNVEIQDTPGYALLTAKAN